jgi:hypothetical protein
MMALESKRTQRQDAGGEVQKDSPECTVGIVEGEREEEVVDEREVDEEEEARGGFTAVGRRILPEKQKTKQSKQNKRSEVNRCQERRKETDNTPEASKGT